MTNQTLSQHSRIIFFHKQDTSARTRFLRFADDTVCSFAPLPRWAQLLDATMTHQQHAVEVHPAVLLKEAAQRLQLPVSAFELEPEYTMWVDVPGEGIRILLARFTTIDPPFAAAEAIGAGFIDLTEARDLPGVELLLLRKAYEVILGG